MNSFIIGQHGAQATDVHPRETSKRAETVGRVDLQWGVKGARSAFPEVVYLRITSPSSHTDLDPPRVVKHGPTHAAWRIRQGGGDMVPPASCVPSDDVVCYILYSELYS